MTAIELVFDDGGVVLNGRAILHSGVDDGEVPDMTYALTSLGARLYGRPVARNRARMAVAAVRGAEG